MAELSCYEAYKAGTADHESATRHVKDLLRRRLISRDKAEQHFIAELNRLVAKRFKRGELPVPATTTEVR
jgi:hypothetical protein